MTWIMMQAMRLMSSYVFSKFAEFVVERLFRRAKTARRNIKPPASRTTIDKKNDDYLPYFCISYSFSQLAEYM